MIISNITISFASMQILVCGKKRGKNIILQKQIMIFAILIFYQKRQGFFTVMKRGKSRKRAVRFSVLLQRSIHRKNGLYAAMDDIVRKKIHGMERLHCTMRYQKHIRNHFLQEPERWNQYFTRDATERQESLFLICQKKAREMNGLWQILTRQMCM